MRNLRWVLLCILFLGFEFYGEHLGISLLENENRENNTSYGSVFGQNRLIANENSDRNANNKSIDNENEEVCDQELVYITVNFGDKFYILCLETDENHRIKGLRYNTYHKETHEFIRSRIYNEDDLGLHDCISSDEIANGISLSSNDFIIGNNTAGCTSSQRINLASKFGFNFLNLQTSHFNVHQGGNLNFSYIAYPMDRSHERLDMRLFRYNDEWRLGDIDNQRIITLDVELNRVWLFFKKIPVGIDKIHPIYEGSVVENK